MEDSQITLKTYQSIAPEFAKRNFYDWFWRAEFAVYHELIPGRKVLDVGCGTGRDAALFGRHRYDYTGIDNSPAMIRHARKRNKNGKFKVMDMTRIHFPQRSFDGFWAAASLLHIPKAKIGGVLKNLYRILKPGGIGFISVKYKSKPWEGLVEDAYVGFQRFFSYYNEPALRKFLEKSGLKVLKLYSKVNKGDATKQKWICAFVRK